MKLKLRIQKKLGEAGDDVPMAIREHDRDNDKDTSSVGSEGCEWVDIDLLPTLPQFQFTI